VDISVISVILIMWLYWWVGLQIFWGYMVLFLLLIDSFENAGKVA